MVKNGFFADNSKTGQCDECGECVKCKKCDGMGEMRKSLDVVNTPILTFATFNTFPPSCSGLTLNKLEAV